MKMYDFRNIDQYAYPIESKAQTIIDGVNLDETINGFMTLAVYGRELVGRNIETAEFRKVQTETGTRTYANKNKNISSYESRFISSSIASREFTIKFVLKAKDEKDYFSKFEELNFYLDKEDVQIRFTDDINFYYWGTVTKVESPQKDNLQAICSISFEVSNPFKFRVDSEKINFNTRTKITKDTRYPLKIEKIKISLKTSGNKLILKNLTDGRKIIFDKNFAADDFIIIDFNDWIIRGKGDENYYKYLDIHSQLEEFAINTLDEIETNLNCDVEIEYREVRL
jgi:hypothetical protein|nr:MAG TPA: Receptor binding protein [Caudoviricetes sp.]